MTGKWPIPHGWVGGFGWPVIGVGRVVRVGIEAEWVELRADAGRGDKSPTTSNGIFLMSLSIRVLTVGVRPSTHGGNRAIRSDDRLTWGQYAPQHLCFEEVLCGHQGVWCWRPSRGHFDPPGNDPLLLRPPLHVLALTFIMLRTKHVYSVRVQWVLLRTGHP